jgi:hypothetical protein
MTGSTTDQRPDGGADAAESSDHATDPDDGHQTTAGTATVILDTIREVVDDLAERATPAIREFSARAAEIAADAADRAAPYVKRAGDATADASGKLAERSRTWAAEVRSSIPESPDGDDDGVGSSDRTEATATSAPDPDSGAQDGAATDGPAGG